jgi:hypothetical protein
MTTSTFSAVGSTRGKTSIAFAADLLIAFVLGGKHFQRRLDDATTKTEDQVQSGLFLDVVVTQSTTVFELFASEDQTLLVGRDTRSQDTRHESI